MYEHFMGDFTFRESVSRQVQLFISSANFTSDQPAPPYIIYCILKDSLPYPKYLPRAHYIQSDSVH